MPSYFNQDCFTCYDVVTGFEFMICHVTTEHIGTWSPSGKPVGASSIISLSINNLYTRGR